MEVLQSALHVVSARRCAINFQTETTTHCNFTCSYCPNKDMQRKREFMTDEVWSTILHKYIVPFRHMNEFCTPTAIFHKDGESLLDRKLSQRLRDLAAVAPDMSISIYSNAVLLPVWAKRGEDFVEVLASLPNNSRLLLSFHPYNHDGSENNYAETILYLRDILRDPPPNVEFITVSHKSKWVSADIQAWWRQQWVGLPITVHSNCSLNPWTGRIEEEGTVKFNGCPYGDFGHWFFGCTGNIIACCLDLEEEIVLGNVLKDNPYEMLRRTEAFYTKQRRILEAKELHPHGVCRNCFGQKREELLQLGTA